MFYSLLLLSFIPLIGCSQIWFRNCGGSEEYLRVDSLDVEPYPIKYPGSISFSPKFEVLKDIPSGDGIKLSIVLDKLTPSRMRIPCYNGFGSCEVDYCREAEKNSFTSELGFGKCPFKKGEYLVENPRAALPNFGAIFEKVMEGDFEGNITLKDGMTNKIYSCVHLKFTVVLNKI